MAQKEEKPCSTMHGLTHFSNDSRYPIRHLLYMSIHYKLSINHSTYLKNGKNSEMCVRVLAPRLPQKLAKVFLKENVRNNY